MRTRLSACCDEKADEIIELLRKNGYLAYYVGGCVRDALMGKTPHDFDIATNALPDQTARLFRENGYAVLETGARHGTVSICFGKRAYEITTFRTESAYRDHRRPDSVKFISSLKEDLSRRDFTINALAFYKEEGLLDYFGGENDLKNRTIRCVGEPNVRFAEDALRILRALRFSAVLDFSMEPDTAAAVHTCREWIRSVSAERICVEFSGILTADGAVRILRDYIDVLGVFLPELLPSVGFPQNSPWHIYDVFAHTLTALGHTPADLTLRLAVLLHDIGKPYVYTQDENGTGHFKGHAALSAELADRILRRLKFGRRLREDVCLLVRHHDDRIPCDAASIKRLIRSMGKENALRLVQVERADRAAQNPVMVAERSRAVEKIGRMIHELTRPDAACITIADLAVSGEDLLAEGIPQGVRIGKALAMLLEEVTEERLPNEREALLRFLRENQALL